MDGVCGPRTPAVAPPGLGHGAHRPRGTGLAGHEPQWWRLQDWAWAHRPRWTGRGAPTPRPGVCAVTNDAYEVDETNWNGACGPQAPIDGVCGPQAPNEGITG